MRYAAHVVVLGDAVTNVGIAATLLGSGLAGRVVTGALDDELPIDSGTVDLFVVHGSGKSDRHEAAIRRIRFSGSRSPIVELSDLGWRLQVERVGKGLLAASIDDCVSGGDLVAVLDLVMGGFSVVSSKAPFSPVARCRNSRSSAWY